MQNKILTIKTMIASINQHMNTYPELVVESIKGYGFDEIVLSIEQDINESEVDSHIMSLMHICDVIDEEVVMPTEFYTVVDEIQGYLAA